MTTLTTRIPRFLPVRRPLDQDVLKTLTEDAMWSVVEKMVPGVVKEATTVVDIDPRGGGVPVAETGFGEAVAKCDKLLQETRSQALDQVEAISQTIDSMDAGVTNPGLVQATAERKRILIVRVGHLKTLAAVCSRLFESMRREGGV